MNHVQICLYGLAIVSASLLGTNSSVLAQQSIDCDSVLSSLELNRTDDGSAIPELNRTDDDAAILIGDLIDRPYIVAVTYDLDQYFDPIRACIPDAFLTSARLGNYIRVASLDNYREARDLADHLGESLGIYVRVVHKNRLRP